MSLSSMLWERRGRRFHRFFSLFVDYTARKDPYGTVRSSRCQAREAFGTRRIFLYVAVTKRRAQSRYMKNFQRDRWTFDKAVNLLE